MWSGEHLNSCGLCHLTLDPTLVCIYSSYVSISNWFFESLMALF